VLVSRNTSSLQTLSSTPNPAPPKLNPLRSEGSVKSAQTFPKPGLQASRPSYSQTAFPPSISQSPFSGPIAHPIQPTKSTQSQSTYSTPSYNIHFSNPITTPTVSPPNIPSTPQQFGAGFPPPPQMSGLLVPSKPAQSTLGQSTNKLSKDDWGDFDPLL
jgi:hypothetical protein